MLKPAFLGKMELMVPLAVVRLGDYACGVPISKPDGMLRWAASLRRSNASKRNRWSRPPSALAKN
jgi:hypothetical protein